MNKTISTITWINIADEEIEVYVRGLYTPPTNDSDDPGEVVITVCKDCVTDRDYLDLIADEVYAQLQQDLIDAYYKK